jgi:hypothetical protein
MYEINRETCLDDIDGQFNSNDQPVMDAVSQLVTKIEGLVEVYNRPKQRISRSILTYFL